MPRKLLISDINGLLVHSTHIGHKRPEKPLTFQDSNLHIIEDSVIKIRPMIHNLLQQCFPNFDGCIWTCANPFKTWDTLDLIPIWSSELYSSKRVLPTCLIMFRLTDC